MHGLNYLGFIRHLRIDLTLVAHVKHEIEIRQIKEMVTKQFLEGKLCFDDFARIVSFDIAQQIKIGKETLKESIERAKRDSKRNL